MNNCCTLELAFTEGARGNHVSENGVHPWSDVRTEHRPVILGQQSGINSRGREGHFKRSRARTLPVQFPQYNEAKGVPWRRHWLCTSCKYSRRAPKCKPALSSKGCKGSAKRDDSCVRTIVATHDKICTRWAQVQRNATTT